MPVARAVVFLALVATGLLASAVDCSSSALPLEVDAGAPFDAGESPYLLSLSVTAKGASAADVTLVPPFWPGTHDYYVRCSAGENRLEVSMAAAAGFSSQLVAPAPSESRPAQTLEVLVKENDAVVAAATTGGSKTEYWVRCLPHDFPSIHMSVLGGAGTAAPGYYLVGNMAVLPGTSGYAMIVDGNGVPVWYRFASGIPVDVDSITSGELHYIGDPTPSTFQRFDPLSAPPASVGPKGFVTDFHDLRPTPSGTYVVLSHENRRGIDLTGIAAPLTDGGTVSLGKDSTIQDCVVVEFQSDGTVVSTWSASDHFPPPKDTTFFDPAAFGAMEPDGGVTYDVYHCNSLDVDPANGNLLISARNMDSVFYVEKLTGKVLWKMGGTTYSEDGAPYVAVANPFFRQHDARLVAGWSPDCHGGTGQVSVFDDETAVIQGGTMPGARGLIYDVVVPSDAGAGGRCALPAPPGQAVLASEYRTKAQSLFGGSVRIGADGSRLVGWGINLGGSVVFSEFDSEGHNLRDFSMLPIGASYRAVKVPLSWFDLREMRRTAGAR